MVKGDAIVWEEAFGWADQQRRIAATTTTPYYLASVTKVLTGTALALLVNEGRIDMNRSVNAYLGSHKLRPALWEENAITVQRVADQMSGLATFDISCASAAPCRLESAVDRFGVVIRPPGETFDYSNLNYGILGAVGSLLADRFKLRAHEEMRERDVYVLVLAGSDRKFGPGLKPTAADESAHCASLEAAPSPAPAFLPDERSYVPRVFVAG